MHFGVSYSLMLVSHEFAYQREEIQLPHKKSVEALEESLYGCPVTTVHVRSAQAAKQLNRAVGDYITVETGETLNDLEKIEDVGECLAEMLERVLRPYYGGTLCVCGLGNRSLSADALGPEVVSNLPLKVIADIGIAGNFRNVCSIEPGTALTNNIYTEAVMNGVVKEIGANCLLLVDSLVTEEHTRLFRMFQLSTNGGLSPRLAERKADWGTLGIPVVSLGVPVSIPMSALSSDQDLSDELFTTIKIQDVIAAAGRIIAYAILRACWPSMHKSECFIFSGVNKNPIPYSFLVENEQKEAGAAC